MSGVPTWGPQLPTLAAEWLATDRQLHGLYNSHQVFLSSAVQLLTRDCVVKLHSPFAVASLQITSHLVERCCCVPCLRTRMLRRSGPQSDLLYDGISLDPHEVMFVKVKEVLLERNSTTALKAAKLDTWQVRPKPQHASP